jgi:hypothetical protein
LVKLTIHQLSVHSAHPALIVQTVQPQYNKKANPKNGQQNVSHGLSQVMPFLTSRNPQPGANIAGAIG